MRSFATTLNPECYAGLAISASAIEAEMFRLVVQTIERHGLGALDMPRRAAAVHEAGHAIVFEAEGIPVRSVEVFSRIIRGREQWGGSTEAGEPWLITPDTPRSVVLQRIRFDLAGVVAEAFTLGDEFNPGSSLDEVARARVLSGHAAVGRPELDAGNIIYAEQSSRVVETIRTHRHAFCEIANTLMTEKRMRGSRLAAALAPVRRAAE